MAVQIVTTARANARLASAEILSDQQHRHLSSCQSRVIARTVKALTDKGAPFTVEFWVNWSEGTDAFARIWE